MKTRKITLRRMSDTSDLRQYGRGELAKEILLMIAAGVTIPAVLLMPGIPATLRPLVKLLTKRCGGPNTQNFVKSLHYLNRKRLVSVAEKDGQQILTVSEDGRKRVLRFNLDRIMIRQPRRWDGYWRLVVFDIPEKKRQGRDALRSKLKELGFCQLQKSCFIHPFECQSEIDFVSELYEVSRHVHYIVAKKILPHPPSIKKP